MRKMAVFCLATVLFLSLAVSPAFGDADALLEKALLLDFAQEQGLSEYEVVELLQGYAEYRQMMDSFIQNKAEKKAALASAIAANESSSVLATLTRELMDIDMGILRLKQSSVNEASSVMSAKAVAQLYALVSDLEGIKANLVAELSGSKTCPISGQPMSQCPMATAAAACPMAAAATAETPAPCAAAAAAPAAPPSGEEILKESLGFLNKLAAKDLEGAMAAVSPEFTHHEYSTKEDLKFFLDQAILMGYLDDIKIISTDAEVKIDGDKAVIYPIDIEGAFGSVTLELVIEKKDGKWMLTTMDAFGL